ncbi:hypothetical protein [Streptomyces shenzhenensis]|uniref:hypothetical protein n=1 Tax=Streptomyces shenzhenensis TaxID=943815 RepID=UPI001F4278F0|nr:hypothetical protein [Streptomyces shenzhenensis]
MTPRRSRSQRPERRFVVVGVRREPTDVRKLAKALLAVVLAEQQRTADAVEPEEGVRG